MQKVSVAKAMFDIDEAEVEKVEITKEQHRVMKKRLFNDSDYETMVSLKAKINLDKYKGDGTIEDLKDYLRQ